VEFRLTPEQIDLLTLDQLRTVIRDVYWLSFFDKLFEQSITIISSEHYDIRVQLVFERSVTLRITGRCFIPVKAIRLVLNLPSESMVDQLSRTQGRHKSRNIFILTADFDEPDQHLMSARMVAKVLTVLQAQRDKRIAAILTRQLDKTAKEPA